MSCVLAADTNDSPTAGASTGKDSTGKDSTGKDSTGARSTGERSTANPNSHGTAVIANSIGMKLVLVPAGEFMQGADEPAAETLNRFPYCDPAWLAGEQPRHRIGITKPFYMGQYEVTLGEFLKFYHSAGYKTDAERSGEPSWGYRDGKFVESKTFRPWAPGFDIGMDHPAVFISYNDAVAFCRWLSKEDGRTYRLPTEAEWEYACRAGNTTRFSCGNDPEELTDYANGSDQERKKILAGAVITSVNAGKRSDSKIPFPFLINSDGHAWSSPVGKFRPNGFGLYDMHGNAWEWCSDWYDEHYYEKSPAADPQGPATGTHRVLRGGGFNYPAAVMRSADRNSDLPSHSTCSYGFRVVCESAAGDSRLADH